MTDPAMAPEAPNVAETVHFLRRFADLMSNGQNSAWLLNAAVQLESLAARVVASSGEEQLWRYKYETLTDHSDHLESECEGLRNDIEGHLELARSLLGEREALAATLQARDAELGELRETLNGEREQLAARSQAHEQTLADLSDGFDGERQALKAIVAAREDELGQLRETLQSEREQFAHKQSTHEVEMAELRLDFGRERDELRSKIVSSEGQLEALRGETGRDSEWMKARIATLEAQRVELRAALDRLNDLQVPAPGSNGAGLAATNGALESGMRASSHSGAEPASQEGSAIVPTATLRHARAQFEYLAKECIRRGDVATQVMCELGAYTLELALKEGDRADHSPAGRMALSILEPEQASSVVADGGG